MDVFFQEGLCLQNERNTWVVWFVIKHKLHHRAFHKPHTAQINTVPGFQRTEGINGNQGFIARDSKDFRTGLRHHVLQGSSINKLGSILCQEMAGIVMPDLSGDGRRLYLHRALLEHGNGLNAPGAA